MPITQMTKVESSQIDSMGHDPIHNVMQVAFKNGGVYSYSNVPETVYRDILTAESVGKAFNATVKKNPSEYPFTKVA